MEAEPRLPPIVGGLRRLRRELSAVIRVIYDLRKLTYRHLKSGIIAQCIALRIWADRASSRQVAFHATSHLQIHEQNAYRELYGLEAEPSPVRRAIHDADPGLTLSEAEGQYLSIY